MKHYLAYLKAIEEDGLPLLDSFLKVISHFRFQLSALEAKQLKSLGPQLHLHWSKPKLQVLLKLLNPVLLTKTLQQKDHFKQAKQGRVDFLQMHLKDSRASGLLIKEVFGQLVLIVIRLKHLLEDTIG